MQTNIEKLAEELSALDSLRSASITIRVSIPDRRIHLNLPFGHTAAFFEFDEILPYDPKSAPGTVSDLCKNNQIHVLTDMDLLTRKQAQTIGPRVFAYLSYLIHQDAKAGKITSPEMAALKFPADELRSRKADLKTIATKFGGSHAAFLKSIDPVAGRDSALRPPSLDGTIDATSARTAEEFLDKFVAKDASPRFPAGPFASLGKALFGEPGWENKMALELKVDKSTIRDWAQEGVPGTMLEALWHISSHHRAKIQEAMKMPGMPDADLKPWHRGARLLEEYELVSQDPTMRPSSTDPEQNRKMVVRIIADMLQFCSHMVMARSFSDMNAVLRDAITMYRTDPEHSEHSFTPVVNSEIAEPDALVPYVLTADPAKMADFQEEFGLSQAAAVDVLIEQTNWGSHLSNLRGKKGKPAERLREIRRVLREAGQTE